MIKSHFSTLNYIQLYHLYAAKDHFHFYDLALKDIQLNIGMVDLMMTIKLMTG